MTKYFLIHTILMFFFTSNAQSIKNQVAVLPNSNAADTYIILKILQNEPKDNFNVQVEEELISFLKSHPPHLDELIKLTGYLELHEAIPQLKIIADSTGYTPRDRWAAYLALARMQDPEALGFINKRIRSLPVNDDFIYDVVPDVIYTRDKILFDYLITLLMDDEPLCTSSNPDNEVAIPCGYRLMEYFAPVIKDYPLKLTASGEVDSDDYPEALQNVRIWFDKNLNTYEIDRDYF